MIHLDDEQIYNLAERTMQMQPYTEEEKEQMEHMKECEICYNKFCATLALEEVMDESGLFMVSEICAGKKELNTISSLSDNVLAVVKVVRRKVEEKLTAVMEQMQELGDTFCFEPPLAFATRGIEDTESTFFKVEDIEDGKTFLMFDFVKNELLIQINIKDREVEEFQVSVEFENGQKQEIPVEKKGRFVKGILQNIPEMDFQIHIKKAK